VLGLLDIEAAVFIKQHALEGTNYQTEQVKLKVKGRYSKSQLTILSIFDVKLPDFCSNRHVTI
jgi:hypothetical protein